MRISDWSSDVCSSDLADLEWLNRISAGAPLHIGQNVKVPNQEFQEAGRDAKNRFIALWLYAETHNHHLPPDPAHPPSIEQQINDPTYWHPIRSEEHTSELQSLMRISYAVFCLKKKKEQY